MVADAPEHLENTNPEHEGEAPNTIVRRAREIASERAKAADRVIRHHPYQMIGVAVGLGLLTGLALRRRA